MVMMHYRVQITMKKHWKKQTVIVEFIIMYLLNTDTSVVSLGECLGLVRTVGKNLRLKIMY